MISENEKRASSRTNESWMIWRKQPLIKSLRRSQRSKGSKLKKKNNQMVKINHNRVSIRPPESLDLPSASKDEIQRLNETNIKLVTKKKLMASDMDVGWKSRFTLPGMKDQTFVSLEDEILPHQSSGDIYCSLIQPYIQV